MTPDFRHVPHNPRDILSSDKDFLKFQNLNSSDLDKYSLDELEEMITRYKEREYKAGKKFSL